VKAILFDLDGTLLDSIPGILASFDHVLARHLPEKTVTRRQQVMMIGEPLEKQMCDFTGGDTALALQMTVDYREHNRGILPTMSLYPGARETVAALRARGQRTGVVTSKQRQSAMLSLDGHGLTPLLDLIMTTDDTVRHKPDPEPLVVACRRLGFRPAEVAYVGDSVYDVRCALGAGCLAVAALWGPFERDALAALGPQIMAESLAELLSEPALRP
jgi:pyrophosphatase PpaX